MSFVSTEFVLLFAVVVPLYFLVPHRWRWLLLLAASYVFYVVSNGVYLVLILVTTTVDFFVAASISRVAQRRWQTALLVVSLFVNLSILFFFKYFNFFATSVASLCRTAGGGCEVATIAVILPVGISFYTFMEMAYVIDVYQGRIRREERLGIFALFVSFFPHLVAGPILRARDLIPQFRRPVDFDVARVVDGFRQMLWGLFKKVVIADRLAVYVNDVYGRPLDYHGPILVVATVFFAFQIYCDFSGYTDIAIGTARVLGFTFMDNFRQPYFAASIREFWQRWHISLSTWFREYLYVPLGGSRVGAVRHSVNLMVVFVVSGLWHGANWTFVLWGAIHGAYMVVEEWFRRRRWALADPRLLARPWLRASTQGVKLAVTFAVVCVAWVFFRAGSVAEAWHVLTAWTSVSGPLGLTRPYASDPRELALALALIAFLLVVDGVDARWGLNRVLASAPPVVRWSWYYGATAVILMLGVWGTQEFIYFQF